MKKLLNTKIYKGLPTLFFGMILWFFSYFFELIGYKMILFLEMKVRKAEFLSEGIAAETVIVVGLLYAVVTFVAVLLILSGLTSLVHQKPFLESTRKQLSRNFAFFGLLPNLIVCSVCNNLITYLPIKPKSYITSLIECEALLDFASATSHSMLYLTHVSALVLLLAFSYGMLVNANVWFDIICTVLWVIYTYNIVYIATRYFEYAKWFLLFIAACYAVIALFLLVHKIKKEEPLYPKYEVLILSYDDIWDDETDDEDDDKEYDFSIFMPNGNIDKNEG